MSRWFESFPGSADEPSAPPETRFSVVRSDFERAKLFCTTRRRLARLSHRVLAMRAQRVSTALHRAGSSLVRCASFFLPAPFSSINGRARCRRDTIISTRPGATKSPNLFATPRNSIAGVAGVGLRGPARWHVPKVHGPSKCLLSALRAAPWTPVLCVSSSYITTTSRAMAWTSRWCGPFADVIVVDAPLCASQASPTTLRRRDDSPRRSSAGAFRCSPPSCRSGENAGTRSTRLLVATRSRPSRRSRPLSTEAPLLWSCSLSRP